MSSQRCECGHQIVRDGVIRSRAVKLEDGTALCRCKRWVRIESLKPRPAPRLIELCAGS